MSPLRLLTWPEMRLKLHIFIFVGASACAKLKRFEEAITWCDKGLAVSLTMYFLFCPNTIMVH